MADDLPYRSEYAKSGRAGCKGCKSTIAKDSLRIAAMVQSAFHDGKQPNWFHMSCFFLKQRPKTTGDIAHFESLRYEDQEIIRKKIEAGGSGVVLPPAKGKKRAKAAAAGLKDFAVEYAKSSRAACCGCQEKIPKGEVRICKKVYDTEVGMKFGGQPLWHHIDCFAQVRDELEYFASGDILPGYKTLSKEDQASVKEKLPAVKQADIPPVKKMKDEPKDEVDKAEDKAEEKALKEQNTIMFKYRDQLKANLSKNELASLLKYNKQDIPTGEERILDRLCDVMTFGALERCLECKGGQYVFHKSGYICTGDLTEWTKCQKVVKEPKRIPFKVPKDLKDEHSFLKKYKYTARTRVIKYEPPSVSLSVKKEEAKVTRPPPPLKNMEFSLPNKTIRPKDELKSFIVRMGGKAGTKIHDKVAAVVATKEEFEKMGKRMQDAKALQIQVIPESFFDDIKDGGAVSYITTLSMCDWGTDPRNRIPVETEASKSKSKSMYNKSGPSKVTLKLKGGGAVDPDSGLEDSAHVYQSGKDKYTVTLGKTDIQNDKNSYYKLQILAADHGNRYWVFRSWGRIGTTIGGNKLEIMGSLDDALDNFKSLYQEKTGNMWELKDQFTKVAGCMYPIDVEYGDDKVQGMATSDIKSELPSPVQQLIQKLFDIDAMKKVMLEFELDMEKMPLGKLSRKQINAAYSVLSEISNLIQKGGSQSKFIDASNRFYTLVPHDFGIEKPTILETAEVLKTKIDMLDSLTELEIAYSMLSSGATDTAKSPIDIHYEQLKTEMQPLPRDDDEFKLLSEYVQNTHAETHKQYDLEIQEIFKIRRKHEDRRYKPFKKLHNRKLLWHGSRFTNFAGILSQGLRIAPPEAPPTGYMFGKGIYFADMVSKSANYCCTNKNNPVGLMLLCEVALGDMYECTKSEYVEKLPPNKHSCKGIGRTQPHPEMKHVRPDGVEVPLGKGVTDTKLNSQLLYNEYIVYDVAQVNCQYLFQMKFKHKY